MSPARRAGEGSRARALAPAAFLLAGAAVAAFMVVLHLAGGLRSLELASVDARFALRGPTAPPPRLVLVTIDDVTFDEIEEQWPFSRARHARVIDRLRRGGARAVAYDVQFSEPSDDADADNALIEAVARARGRVVLAATETDETGESNVFGGGGILRDIGARAGHALLPTDPGGVIRRVPFAVGGLPTLAVATTERVTRAPVPRPFPAGGAWIDYHGAPRTIRSVPFSRVLRGRVRRGFFRGAIVVVGPTAPSLQDLHATSTTGDSLMSGAEVQANAISTVLRGLPLKGWPRGAVVLVLVLAAMLAPLAATRLGAARVAAVALAAGAVYAGVAHVAFVELGTIVPVVLPLLALGLGLLAALALQAMAASVDRRRTRDLFCRFVGDEVVDAVLAHSDGARLGGERLCSTVVFCDLRGFTSFAEGISAERVIEVLNRYLGEMSEAILNHGGTLVSYQGDGIMSVFGAPIEHADHADRALEAAREMLTERLPRFNAWVRGEGLAREDFRMGIGINSGTVMSGHVGSERRLEYTALGDTTNTAARLQAKTKEYRTAILISDTTRAMLRRDAPDLRYLDAVSVRGKLVKVNLWTLAGGQERAPAEAAGESERSTAAAPDGVDQGLKQV